MGLIDSLPAGPIAIDTQIVIYFIQRHPDFVDAVRPLFGAADRGRIELVTSTLTLVEVGVPILRAAAHLRAVHGTRAPDAIQLASALVSGCGAFVTHDRRLRSLPNLPVVQLRDSV